MKLLTHETAKTLLGSFTPPCISLYMPTHRSHPKNAQDPIRFKNLLKQLESSLAQQYATAETKELLEPFYTLSDDHEFWNNTANGLAVFSAEGFFEVIGLYTPVAELAIVADSFHTKPIRQYLQSKERYHVLGISLHEVHFYEGTRHSLTKVNLDTSVPATIKEALGAELTEDHLTVASYGGAGAGSTSMYHGHGTKTDEMDTDAEKFFRVVAHAIHERYSKPTGLPLLLAALPEHHHLFHSVNKNPYLLPNGIEVNPTSIDEEKFARLAWEVMKPEHDKRLEKLVDTYRQAKANGTGSNDLHEVAEAARIGKVQLLLLEAGRIIAGRISETKITTTQDLADPHTDDLLDDIGELVIKMGGEVTVIPLDKMPGDTGLAAIFRY